MSSKLNISIFAKEENAFNTKDKALKKATKDVPKEYRRKALGNGSTVRNYSNYPNRWAHRSKFHTAKYFQKHGYVYCGGDRKDKEIKEADASLSVVQSSSTVDVTELYLSQQKRLRKWKETADLAEEIARRHEKRVEDEIKFALNTKATAEMLRKNVEDAEKSLRNGTSIHSQRFVRGIKRTADLAEEIARRKAKRIDDAIKLALNTKATAEMLRKNADDKELFLHRLRREGLSSCR